MKFYTGICLTKCNISYNKIKYNIFDKVKGKNEHSTYFLEEIFKFYHVTYNGRNKAFQ